MTFENAPRWMPPLSLALSLAALTVSLTTACEETAPDARQGPHETSPPGETAAPVVETATREAEASPARAAHEPKAGSGEGSVDPEPRSAPAETMAARSTSVTVKRLVVTRGIEDREPVSTTTLAPGQPVFAFIEAKNEGDDEGALVITFEHDTERVGHVELKVPGDTTRWRTWGKTGLIRTPGTWIAIVRSKDGQELARQPFEVTEA